MAHWQTLIVVTVLDEVLRNINFKGVNHFRYKNNTTQPPNGLLNGMQGYNRRKIN